MLDNGNKKRIEMMDYAEKVNKEKLKNYKEKQKAFKARSKIGKWFFNEGGTYKKQNQKETE